MLQLKANNKLVSVAAPIGLAVGIALGSTSAMAAEGMADEGRVFAAGEPVTTSYGECVEAAGGNRELLEQCGDIMPMAEVGDSDGDGVPDDRDRCPGTPRGVAVDANGCPLDSDGDGVPDYLDKCPGTPPGAKVDSNGCEIMGDVTISVTVDHFAFDSAVLKPKMEDELDRVAARILESRGDEYIEIIGHTDSTGPESWNQGLSERRAEAAAEYLISQGIPADRISTMGMGESQPIADNATREGRAMNRRVEVRTR